MEDDLVHTVGLSDALVRVAVVIDDPARAGSCRISNHKISALPKQILRKNNHQYSDFKQTE